MEFKPIKMMMDSKNKHVHCFGHYLAYLWQYRNILATMVKKDFKGRFKYTVLGYAWHLLNPLSQIIIYLIIFTAIFGQNVPYYWVYTSTGMFAFIFFSSCVVSGSNVIVNNSAMVTKIAFDREILVFSKVISNLITLGISYVLLTILMLLTGAGPTLCILFVPLIIILFTIFAMGLTFLFSALTVYLRDISNAIGILMGCMMFAVPILYLASQRSTPFMNTIWSINPLYYFIECIHDAFYWGIIPDLFNFTVCIIIAPITFVLGIYVFKKLERGFAERL